MSDTITAIAEHNFNFSGHIQDLGENLIEKCMATFGVETYKSFTPQHGKRLYDYDFWYDANTNCLSMRIEGPSMLTFTLYPNLVDIDDGYSYSMLRSQDFPFNEGWYRKELFKMVEFLQLSEVIYLPTDRHPLSKYADMAAEGKSYQEIKKHLFTDLGAPMLIQNFNTEEVLQNWKSVWILDNFGDYRDKVKKSKLD